MALTTTRRGSDCLRSLMYARRSNSVRVLCGVLGLFTLILALAVPAFGHSYLFGEIAVGHMWAPPVKASEGDVYGSVLNQGEAGDRLLAASTPVAEHVVFRFGDESAARAAIPLPPGKPVSFASWGYHLHFTGLARPLEEGESFELTLTFENAGARTVRVVVEPQPGH